MLKGLTNTFKQHCNNVELEYSEYVVLNGTQIPIKAQLKDDSYENGNFIGTFILKQISFETEATYDFKDKEFEYYKVVDNESIKIGTFISTDITINDTTNIVKVVGMDYGLKTQIEYTSSLDYSSGNITLMDVWNECCSLSGLESGIKDFTNSDFIVDSDQFTKTGATVRDVFKAIAMSSGTFVKVMNDDKIYLVFNEYTSDIENIEINGSATIQDGYKLEDLELKGDTTQETTTGKNLFCLPDAGSSNSITYTINDDGTFNLSGTASNNAYFQIYKDLTEANITNGETYTWSSNKALPSGVEIRLEAFNGTTWVRHILGYVLSSTTQVRTATASVSNATRVRFLIYVNNGTQTNISNIGIQLEKSSTQTSFEKYTNGASPNPTYPQEVQVVSGRQEIDVVGKNWFNYATTETYTTSQNGAYLLQKGIDTNYINVSQQNNGYYVNSYVNTGYRWFSMKVNLPKNTDFKFLCGDTNITVLTNIRLYGFNTLVNGTTGTQISSLKNGTTFNTGDYEYYLLCIYPHQQGTYIKDIQIVKSNVEDTTFEEYKGNTYEINLGKNLYYMNYADYTYNNFNGTDITSTHTGYSISGTASSTTAFTLVNRYITLQAGTYTMRLKNASAMQTGLSKTNYSSIVRINAGQTSNTFTLTEETKACLTIGITNGTQYNEENEVMIEKGSVASSFSPYKTPIELCKIGTYQDFIKKGTGKNLLPNNNTTQTINNITFTKNDDGSITMSGTANNNNADYYFVGTASDYVDLGLPTGTYNLSGATGGSGNTYMLYMVLNRNGTLSYYQSYTSSGTNISIQSGDKFRIFIRVIHNTTPNATIYPQLELGTKTSYEPYGMYNKWYIEKQIGKIIFNGSEANWSAYRNANNLIYYGIPISTGNPNANRELLSNNFVKINSLWDLTSYTNAIQISANLLNILIMTTDYTTLDTFKTWLSTHNTSIYYVLNTPTYTKITDSELISQLNAVRLIDGLNNITISSNDLSSPLKISYYNNELEIVEDYTELEDKRDTHPWTCLRLGTTQIEGNNLDYIDQDLVDKYGENWLILNDNPFAYNQEKRSQLIENIFNQIKEFGYSAFVSKTSFKPYLTSGDIIRFKNRNGEFVKSILLRYNHNNEVIQLEAPSETSATVNYVRPLDTAQALKNTQIIVNQDTQEINSLAQSINTLSSMVDSQGNDIDTLGTIITQTTESITASVSAIQETLDNGIDLVKTTSVSIDNNGINVSTDLSKIATIISNNAFKIVPKGSTEPLAHFGYDEEQNISVAKMDNLTITTYLNAGAHRIEKYTEDGEERTGFFYIGG